MRIGIIGPAESVHIVMKEAEKADLPLTCVPLAYRQYFESPDIVEKNRDRVDAFLFTGSTPYSYTLLHMQPEELWGVLPRSVNALLCAMLKTTHQGGHDISKISVDSYDEETLRSAYAEIDLGEKDLVILAHQFLVGRTAYIDQLFQFHRDNVLSGRARFCLTGIQAVYELLQKEGIPVTKAFATSEIILQQLQRLYLLHMADAAKEHRVSVLSIQLKFSQERSLYGKSDLQFFLYKTKAMNEIYAFAQKIGAAVEGHDNEQCRLYTTESIIEAETRGFTQLSLLQDLERLEGIMTVSIGIGIGTVAADAKYHADFGKGRAVNTSRSSIFIVYDDHTIVGPIVTSSRKTPKVLVDRELNSVSRKTGVGIERLHQLDKAVRMRGIDSATSCELAELCGMTPGNMNRMLGKLEKNGFARVIGKQPSWPLGRPSRIFQLLF